MVLPAAPSTVLAYEFWAGQKLQSTRECPMSLDVETEMIGDEREIPRFAIAVASDGRTNVVIHADSVGPFLLVHRDGFFVGHNVSFDFWAIHQHLNQRCEFVAARVLWDACNEGRLLDTMVLDQLIQLGTGNYRAVSGGVSGNADSKIYPGSLAAVAADYISIPVSKEDPYRTRFGELLGCSPEDLSSVDPRFFEYAITDAVATHWLYPALTEVASSLMWEHGFRPNLRDRYLIRPDAIDRFGYLTETTQVKASIALAYMFRKGVHVDVGQAEAMRTEKRQRLETLTQFLAATYPEVLKFDRKGNLQKTPKGGGPSLGNLNLNTMLEQVGRELLAAGNLSEIPQSGGKTGGISRSTKAWKPYRQSHPFLNAWIEVKELEKLLEFLEDLMVPVQHCQYSVLMRTGRTSCAASRSEDIPGINLQQMPSDEQFRALFIPRSDQHQLFIADYSAIELRTLAATCLAWFGSSKLSDVIRSGMDPHAYTASMILGLSFGEFQKLAETDPTKYKQARQASKAINFGVPGGLGVPTLQALAESNYRVTLSIEEAENFRSKLISEIYPELNDRDGYLADPTMKSLAGALQVPLDLVWEQFDSSGQQSSIAARGVAKVIRGTSTATEFWKRQVWEGLYRLTNFSQDLDPEIATAIHNRDGSQQLGERLLYQSVATLTGRVRAGVGFTDSKNTPFQGLAADGAKLAMWNLLHAGFDLYGFVHDELLVCVNRATAQEEAKAIHKIMNDSMAEVLGPIPAASKWIISDHWKKPD